MSRIKQIYKKGQLVLPYPSFRCGSKVFCKRLTDQECIDHLLANDSQTVLMKSFLGHEKGDLLSWSEVKKLEKQPGLVLSSFTVHSTDQDEEEDFCLILFGETLMTVIDAKHLIYAL